MIPLIPSYALADARSQDDFATPRQPSGYRSGSSGNDIQPNFHPLFKVSGPGLTAVELGD